jgi:hypothetical protein
MDVITQFHEMAMEGIVDAVKAKYRASSGSERYPRYASVKAMVANGAKEGMVNGVPVELDDEFLMGASHTAAIAECQNFVNMSKTVEKEFIQHLEGIEFDPETDFHKGMELQYVRCIYWDKSGHAEAVWCFWHPSFHEHLAYLEDYIDPRTGKPRSGDLDERTQFSYDG